MKQVLFAFALVTALTATAGAEIRKGKTYDSYVIEMRTASAVELSFKTIVSTTDSCNHFGLSGALRKVEVPEGGWNLFQDYVADFDVISTQIGCPPSDRVRRIPLESPKTLLEPAHGGVFVRVLVPSDMTPVVTPGK